MSKIICDICGTVYPDSATACPICGYPRQDNEKGLPEEKPEGNGARAASAPVKGGRFSNKNVKKRTQSDPEAPKAQQRSDKAPVSGREAAGRGLKATVAVLAAGVLLVGGYIGYRFWVGRDAYKDNTNQAPDPVTSTQTVTEEPQQTTESAPAVILCTELTISDTAIEFGGAGRSWKLKVTPVPADATEEVRYESSDPSVATVDPDGTVTSVAPGTAVITITCGDVVRKCAVNCEFETGTVPSETETEPEETTEPTEPVTEGHAYADSNWKLNREDVTLIIGEYFELKLTNDAGETAEVTWEADNAGVVTIDGNEIKGVAAGMTDVSVTIDGVTYRCIVRVITNR